jgi:hypothetical protein
MRPAAETIATRSACPCAISASVCSSSRGAPSTSCGPGRPGDVRDVQRKDARAHRPVLGAARERAGQVPEPAEEAVEGLGVVAPLASACLARDCDQALERIVLLQREVHEDERVAIRGVGLALLMQADRDLHAQSRRRRPDFVEPGTQAGAHRAERHVVHGRALRGGVTDPPQLFERSVDEGDLAARADVPGQRGGDSPPPELLAQRARQVGRPPQRRRGATRRSMAARFLRGRLQQQLARRPHGGHTVCDRVMNAPHERA